LTLKKWKKKRYMLDNRSLMKATGKGIILETKLMIQTTYNSDTRNETTYNSDTRNETTDNSDIRNDV